jgi:hypothetical protein
MFSFSLLTIISCFPEKVRAAHCSKNLSFSIEIMIADGSHGRTRIQ